MRSPVTGFSMVSPGEPLVAPPYSCVPCFCSRSKGPTSANRYDKRYEQEFSEFVVATSGKRGFASVLWAREVGEGQSLQRVLCDSCEGRDKTAIGDGPGICGLPRTATSRHFGE
jgi:hypothetical protein